MVIARSDLTSEVSTSEVLVHRFLGLVPALNGGDDAVGVRGPEEGFRMRVFRGAGPFLGSHYGYSGNPPPILCWFRLPRPPRPVSFLGPMAARYRAKQLW